MAQTTILHVSDTHLGKRQYGSAVRQADFAAAFERAIDEAVDRDVDAVVHTGDLFDDPQPTLATVMRCAAALDPLVDADIPFYGIVGHQGAQGDEQWLDLLRRTSAVTRLSREPAVVGEVALYGIDAIRGGPWEQADFFLETPPASSEWTILCMHELLKPPVDQLATEHTVTDVLDRVPLALDGLALGGLHKPRSTRVEGTDVWYAGATERCGGDEMEPGVVQLLEVDDGELSRRQLELDSRPFADLTIAFGEGDELARVRDAFAQQDLEDAVVRTDLVVDGGSVSATEVAGLARDAGAAVVHVEDNRDRGTDSVAAPTPGPSGGGLPADQPAEGEQAAGTAGDGAEDDQAEPTGEHAELLEARAAFDRRLSRLNAKVEDIQTEVTALEADLETAVSERDAATEAFLPAGQPAEAVNSDTRGGVAAYRETLQATRDERREERARKQAALTVERKTAADARDDIAEIARVIDRLEERIADFETVVAEERDDLAAARSQFQADLSALAEDLASFDVTLTAKTLEAVVDEAIPERLGALQASIDGTSEPITELKARREELRRWRDDAETAAGAGTCPTCDGDVDPAGAEGEVAEIEAELTQIADQLAAVTDERIERREILAGLRDDVLALQTRRAETVTAGAARVDDLQADLADHQADIEEARTELAAIKRERDEADDAIVTLEAAIDDLDAAIENLGARIDEGGAVLDAFEAVDALEARLAERTEVLVELGAELAEMKTERDALDAEIDALAS